MSPEKTPTRIRTTFAQKLRRLLALYTECRMYIQLVNAI